MKRKEGSKAWKKSRFPFLIFKEDMEKKSILLFEKREAIIRKDWSRAAWAFGKASWKRIFPPMDCIFLTVLRCTF